MAALLFEIEGLKDIVAILESIIQNEDRDSPNAKRSKELLEHCNEVLDNYVGVENDFSCPNIKEIYHELLLDILDRIVDKAIFSHFKKMQIKYVQLCEQNDDMIILHVGDCDAS